MDTMNLSTALSMPLRQMAFTDRPPELCIKQAHETEAFSHPPC